MWAATRRHEAKEDGVHHGKDGGDLCGCCHQNTDNSCLPSLLQCNSKVRKELFDNRTWQSGYRREDQRTMCTKIEFMRSSVEFVDIQLLAQLYHRSIDSTCENGKSNQHCKLVFNHSHRPSVKLDRHWNSCVGLVPAVDTFDFTSSIRMFRSALRVRGPGQILSFKTRVIPQIYTRMASEEISPPTLRYADVSSSTTTTSRPS